MSRPTGSNIANLLKTVLLSSVLAMASLQAQDTGDSAAHAALATYRPPVPAMEALVTSANPLASSAGAKILAQGGTAADAAVAVAAVLNVVEPQSSGLGGNGYVVYFDRKNSKVHSLAAHAPAPLAADPEKLDAKARNYGMLASTAPGMMGGLIELLDRHGRLSLAQVLEPAIHYARDGHPANASLVASIRRQRKDIEAFPSTARVFLPDGQAPEVGEVFRQADFAATLQKLVDAEQAALAKGATRSAALGAAQDRFYRGDIAAGIVAFFAREGGLITGKDLANYQPRWSAPLHTAYRGYDVYANADATRGGVEVLMQLNLIEGFDLRKLGFQSADTLHLMAESIKLAKSDIYRHVADPTFVDVPWGGLVSKEYANERRKLIAIDAAMAYPQPGVPPRTIGLAVADTGVRRQANLPERYPDDPDTTSFTIVDSEGNTLVSTPTVGNGFGAGVVVGETGLLFNNGMRLGSTAPYPDNVNALQGGKVPLLNNSPIIVLKDGKLVLALGTPGGESIGQTQFQGILNVLDFGLNIQQAIEAPRIRMDADPNFYLPGAAIQLALESRFPESTLEGLRRKGHALKPLEAWTASVGGMQGAAVDEKHGTLTGGADPRRAGYAIGW